MASLEEAVRAVGLLQLGLAMMALWGLVAYTVSRRTTEMGIRLALAAAWWPARRAGGTDPARSLRAD